MFGRPHFLEVAPRHSSARRTTNEWPPNRLVCGAIGSLVRWTLRLVLSTTTTLKNTGDQSRPICRLGGHFWFASCQVRSCVGFVRPLPKQLFRPRATTIHSTPALVGIYNNSEAFPMAGVVLRTFKLLKVVCMEISDFKDRDPEMSTFRN